MKNLEFIEPLAFHSLKNLETIEIKNNPRLNYIDPFAFYDTLADDKPNIVKNIDLRLFVIRYLRNVKNVSSIKC